MKEETRDQTDRIYERESRDQTEGTEEKTEGIRLKKLVRKENKFDEGNESRNIEVKRFKKQVR